jgi:hypothetical protein
MGVQEQANRVLARFNQRTAGEFPPEPGPGQAPPGAPQKRDIPKDHAYDPKALKPMAKALFAASVALGHTLAAHKHFAQIKSPAVSPDGRIGGRGYVMSMNEIRRKLWEASEALSTVSDALHDEIGAPHWKPKLAQLDENDAEDVSRFVEEAQEVRDAPGEDAEEQIEKIDKENDDKDEEVESSQVPNGGASDDSSQVREDPAQIAKEASQKQTLLDEQDGGPRVDSRDPGEGTGFGGSWNPPEDAPSDGWGEGEGQYAEYDYPSEWSNDMREVSAEAQQWAESAMPLDLDTPTEGQDFGLGYGAKGQADDYLGEWGPHSGMPGTPWQAVGDTTPAIDVNINERHSLNNALLPGDESEPVARADYYEGAKGNTVSNGIAPEEEDLGLIDTGYVYEDLDTTRLPLGEPGFDW